jgi:hypothetical protein
MHVRDIVAQYFWKFLGPNPIIRKRRIENGEFYDYIALAWNTMTFGDEELLGDSGLIEGFNPEKYDYGTVWKQFRNTFRLLLTNATTAYNNKAKLGGISGLKGSIARGTLGKDEGISLQSYDAKFDDASASGGKNELGFVDDVADDFVKKEDKIREREWADEFFDIWQKFTKDDDMLDESNGVSAAKVFALAIGENDATSHSLAKRFCVKQDTIISKLKQAVKIMNEYDITEKELQAAMVCELIGNDKLAKYLDFRYDKTIDKNCDGKDTAKSQASQSINDDGLTYAQRYYQKLLAAGKVPKKNRKQIN